MLSKSGIRLGCRYTTFEESNLHSDFEVDCEKCRRGLENELEAIFDFKIEKAAKGNLYFEISLFLIWVAPIFYFSIVKNSVAQNIFSYELKIWILILSMLSLLLVLIEPLIKVVILKRKEKKIKFMLKSNLHLSTHIETFLINNHNYITKHREIFQMLLEAKNYSGVTIYQNELIKNKIADHPERVLIQFAYLLLLIIGIWNKKELIDSIHTFLYTENISYEEFLSEYLSFFIVFYFVTILVIVNSWFRLFFRRNGGIPMFLNRGYILSHARTIVDDILKEKVRKK